MSNDVDPFEIPRFGNAKVAFLGTEIGDAKLFIGSIFLGLLAGKFIPGMGLKGYVGIPLAGYFLNRAWVDWKTKSPAGFILAKLYSFGIFGYSKAFTSRSNVFVGDATIINPAPLEERQGK